MTALPVGGSTGLSHEHTAAIDEATAWLLTQRPWPSPIVPAIRQRFGLSPVDACAAIREASLRLGRAH